VHQRYGAMTGNRNAVTLSDPQGTSAFATYDGTKHKVLVARHVGCHVSVDSNCGLASNQAPAPTTGGVVRVKVAGTVTSVPVTVERIPDVGALASPVVDFSGTVAVSGGIVSVSLPAVADGDAYAITVG
jgi:hypothetical protein